MKPHRPSAVLFTLAACAALSIPPAARAGSEGALTLVPTPTWAALLPLAAGRHDEMGRALPNPADDAYDRRISDSFIKHSFAADSFHGTAPVRATANGAEQASPATLPTTPVTVAPVTVDPVADLSSAMGAARSALPEPHAWTDTAAVLPASALGAATLSAAPGVAPAAVAAWQDLTAPPVVPAVTGGWSASPAVDVRHPVAASGLSSDPVAAITASVAFPAVSGTGSFSGVHRDAARATWTTQGIPVNPASFQPQVPAPTNPAAAKAWGYNTYNDLGNGTTTNTSSPVQVSGLTNGVTAVAAGGDTGLAIQNGALYAWGYNVDGEVGDGTTTQRATPVAISGFGSGVTAIAGGQANSFAVRNGAVYAWGANDQGQLGIGTTNGAANNSPNPTPVATLVLTSGVTAIASGGYHNLAIKSGAAYAWGGNSYGQVGNGTTSTSVTTPVQVNGLGSGVTAIATGIYHSLAIQNGSVKAWGIDQYGELGNNSTTNGGGVNPFSTPVQAIGLTTGVTAIAAGGYFSLAVKGGNVYSWGSNANGALGNGTTTEVDVPTMIDPTDLKNIIAVAAGNASSYALSSDGSLWVWGANDTDNGTEGLLGLGTTTAMYLTPQHLLPPTGYYYSAIDSDADGDFVDAILVQGTPVPEPSTYLGGALLLGAAAWTLRRRSRRA